LEFSIGLERRRETMEMLYILLAISLEEEEEGEGGYGGERRRNASSAPIRVGNLLKGGGIQQTAPTQMPKASRDEFVLLDRAGGGEGRGGEGD
jgi:hypothetical protein